MSTARLTDAFSKTAQRYKCSEPRTEGGDGALVSADARSLTKRRTRCRRSDRHGLHDTACDCACDRRGMRLESCSNAFDCGSGATPRRQSRSRPLVTSFARPWDVTRRHFASCRMLDARRDCDTSSLTPLSASSRDRFWPILLKNSVSRGARKIAGPQRLCSISDVGGGASSHCASLQAF